ncbi:MAG: methionyl-tRNA formyltransferase [Clostridiales bacterium]|nr:methionyl-tRNA formyltransferase [Clostridiales bacterium]
MKIVFMGTPDFAVPALERLAADGHEIALVVTKPDAMKGRGNKVQASPVKEKALALGLPVVQPGKVKGNTVLFEQLRQIAPDAIVVIAYGKILPKEILEIPRYGCLNVHGSLLPRHRGAAPIQWTILAGDEKGGVAVMQMDEGMDTGAVLAETAVPADRCNAEELFEILAEKGAVLIAEVLARIEAGESLQPAAQNDALATYAPMITKQDGLLDFSRSAAELERRVRGLYPWPGTFTYLDGQPFKIWKAAVVRGAHGAVPGTVLRADAEGILIACAEDALLATEVQAPGKKRMAADAYLKGHSIENGTVLG